MRLRAAGIALAFLVAASPAHAALKLCNRTSYILYAATSSVISPGSATHGWIRIAPGDCAIGLPEKLTAQSYLVYARAGLSYSGPERAWGGNFPSCVEQGQFTLHQTVTQPYCTGATFAVPFAAVDTHGKTDWTMSFDEQPALPNLEAAQLAGVRRLLQESGYKIPRIDGKPDKATGAALKDFRKKAGLGDRGGNAELFAALENRALAHGAAPDGYTICNDGKSNVAAAVAQRNDKEIVSRGWWRIAPSACARLITTSLKGTQTWLLAQRPGGATLVSGPDKFCIAAGAFEIKGRSCPASSQAGFLATPLGDVAGRIVHLNDKGLSP
jgi:uncharacterized membrane protein